MTESDLSCAPESHEPPSLKGQKHQRDHFHGGEDGPHRHVNRRRTTEVKMVHRADHAADGIEDDVEIDNSRGRGGTNHAQENVDVRHHDGREQFQEILDPEVNDPEPPEVHHGEVDVLAEDHAYGIEKRDGQRTVEEQVRQIARMFVRQTAPQPAYENDDPEEHADGQQDLPKPPEIKVLPALRADPEPRAAGGNDTLEAGRLAQETADDNYHHRAKQDQRQFILVFGLASGDHRGQENPHGEVTGGDKEQRQLNVPHARQVVG